MPAKYKNQSNLPRLKIGDPFRQVSVRMPPKAYGRLDDLAYENRTSVTDYVRQLIHEHLVAGGFTAGLGEKV